MKVKGIFCALVVVTMNIALFTNNVFAETENFTVQAFAETTRSISLQQGDHVSIGYTIVAVSSSEFDFRITDPSGQTILNFTSTDARNVSFAATETGTYILHFDNSQSSDDKFVTWNYNTDQYVMGIPQSMFLVVIIAIILVIFAAVYAILGKSRY